MATFLDSLLGVSEAKVTYLTKPTYIDYLFKRSFLRLLPDSVTPNQITKFRLFSIPFIAVLLALDHFAVATTLFLFAAFSDALDGALARTQKRITTWGTLYDPIADKLLIGSVAVITISKYLSVGLAATIVALELFLIASAYHRYKGRVVPAKSMGKTKMILQCLGVIALLFYILLCFPWLLVAATWILYGAITFALLSLLVFRSI